MDEHAGNSPDEGEGADSKPASGAQSAAGETPSEGKADASKLPVVWSPKLDAGSGAGSMEDLSHELDDEPLSSANAAMDEPSEPIDEPASDAARPRSLRFAMLAASLAAAAALGSLAGSFSATGVGYFWQGAPPHAATASYSGTPQSAKELAELSTLRTNLDGVSRNANSQFAKLAERLERIERAQGEPAAKLAERLDRIERAQAEPAARLAHLAEAIDRLEKKGPAASATSAAPAAPETTGTIASNPPAPPVEAKPPENVLRDWIVQDVRGNRALIQNRLGALFDVANGSILPGLGKVETIKRQDNHWIVVTAHGLIYSAP
jgi:TolA-binding protein